MPRLLFRIWTFPVLIILCGLLFAWSRAYGWCDSLLYSVLDFPPGWCFCAAIAFIIGAGVVWRDGGQGGSSPVFCSGAILVCAAFSLSWMIQRARKMEADFMDLTEAKDWLDVRIVYFDRWLVAQSFVPQSWKHSCVTVPVTETFRLAMVLIATALGLCLGLLSSRLGSRRPKPPRTGMASRRS